MKLRIDQLDESPRSFAYEQSPGWWSGRVSQAASHEGSLDGTLQIGFEAHRIAGEIVIAGELEGACLQECSRCLARYRHALRETFRLILEPAGERVPPDPEGRELLARDGLYLGDELEAGWYRGDAVALDAYFAELVSLAWPVQPLCREDCAGLCPGCGARRSETPCDCAEEKPDSPFAVLASLRNEIGKGDP